MSRRLSGIDPELGLDALEQLERERREERRAALRAVEEQVEDPPGVDHRRVEEAVLSTEFDCDCEYVSDPPIVFVAVAGGKTMASSSGTVVPDTMSGRMSLGSILVNTYSGAKGYAFSNWKRAVKQYLSMNARNLIRRCTRLPRNSPTLKEQSHLTAKQLLG